MRLQTTATSRTFRLRSRRSLIAAVVAVQALVIGLGWLATLHLAHSGLTDRLQGNTEDKNSLHAQTFASLLRSQVSRPVRAHEETGRLAQGLVEEFHLQPGARLFLVDKRGRVLCHPQIKSGLGLLDMDYSELIIQLTPDGELASLSRLNPRSPVSGVTDLLNGPVSITLLYEPNTDCKIVVISPLTGEYADAQRLTAGMFFWGGLAGVMVLLLTILGSVLLVRRYDSIIMRVNRQLEEELDRRVRRGLVIRNGLIFGLAKLADYRDTDTGKHLERICSYCEILAEALRRRYPDIDRAWIERLKLASSLHDIGKVGIPDSILLKPGAFTPQERRIMETHAVLGADTLIAVRRHVGDDDLLNMAIQIALAHHERFDGKGYPSGLSGEQIPLCARIVALADIYDALTSRRVYKPAMSHAEARQIIVDARGTQLDPDVVDAFECIHADFDRIRSTLQEAHNRPVLLEAVERAEQARKHAA